MTKTILIQRRNTAQYRDALTRYGARLVHVAETATHFVLVLAC